MDRSLAPDGWPTRTSLGPKRRLLSGLDGQRIRESENQTSHHWVVKKQNKIKKKSPKQKANKQIRGVLVWTHYQRTGEAFSPACSACCLEGPVPQGTSESQLLLPTWGRECHPARPHRWQSPSSRAKAEEGPSQFRLFLFKLFGNRGLQSNGYLDVLIRRELELSPVLQGM